MMIRGQFSDFFFETMLPALNAKVWRAQRLKPKTYPKLYDIETTGRSIEQRSQMVGVGMFGEVAEGASTNTDNFQQGFDKTFKPRKFGLGIACSQELVEDDKLGIVSRRAVALAEAAEETCEVDAASTFNNAFTAGAYAGPDAVALCSASHPLVKAGGLQSNVLSVAADLDVSSLELALTGWETQVSAEGFALTLPTPRLLVAPANRWNAHEILKGEWRSDSANRTVNAFRFAENGPVSEIIVWNKLTDADAWFLVAPPEQTGLLWLWRKRMYTRADYIEKKETGILYMRYRKDHGFHDYVGVFGTAGAG